MAERILALDPANRTGWAYVDAEGRRLSGAFCIAKRTDRHPGARIARFMAALREFLVKYPVDVVACEDSHFGTRNHETAAMHAELRGLIKLMAYERGARFIAYKPSTIKKFATGYGKAEKSQMIKAARTVLGVEVDDDDEADALFILELARRRRGGSVDRC